MKRWTRCLDLSFLRHAHWQSSSALAESSTGKRRTHWGHPGRATGAPGISPHAASKLWWGASKSARRLIQEWNPRLPQPSDKLRWFSNQLRGLIFPVLDSRLKPLHSQEACDFPLLLWVARYGCESWLDHFSSPSARLHVVLSSQLWLYKSHTASLWVVLSAVALDAVGTSMGSREERSSGSS